MFRINLHHHVKVWFHTDTNTTNFINYENRLRLINFRKINPHDKASLIYSRELLSIIAEENLLSFCKAHVFNPLAVEDLASEIETHADKILYQLLINEIKAIKNKQGGNHAAASDIIRWITKIRKLGNYTDLDTDVNTNGLPEFLIIDKPFLTNYGSIIEIKNKNPNKNVYSLICNNDVLMFGTINPEASQDDRLKAQKELDEIIAKVVNWIRSSYTSTSKHFKNILENDFKAIKEIVYQINPYSKENDVEINKMFDESPITEQFLEFQNKKYGDNPIEIRRNLDKKHSSCYQFALDAINATFVARMRFFCEYQVMPEIIVNDKMNKHKLVDFYAEQSSNSPELKVLLKKGAVEYTNYIMNGSHHALYKTLVINTTGPKLFFSIIGSNYLFKEEESKITCYSLSHYGLDKNFKSKLPITMNADKAPEADVGQGSDLYWLPAGKKEVEKRERESAARVIQSYVRLFNHSVSNNLNPENNSENNSNDQDAYQCRIQ